MSGGMSAVQLIEKVSSHIQKITKGFFQPSPLYFSSIDRP